MILLCLNGSNILSVWFTQLLNKVWGLEVFHLFLPAAYKSLSRICWQLENRVVLVFWGQLAGDFDQSSSNGTMAEQRRNQAPSELLNKVWGLAGCPLKGQPVFTNFNKRWAQVLQRHQRGGWLHKSQLCKAWLWRLLKTHVLDAWCWLSQIRTTLQLMW